MSIIVPNGGHLFLSSRLETSRSSFGGFVFLILLLSVLVLPWRYKSFVLRNDTQHKTEVVYSYEGPRESSQYKTIRGSRCSKRY